MVQFENVQEKSAKKQIKILKYTVSCKNCEKNPKCNNSNSLTTNILYIFHVEQIRKLERKVSVTSAQNVELRRLLKATRRRCRRDGRSEGSVAETLKLEVKDKKMDVKKLKNLLLTMQQHYQEARQRRAFLDERLIVLNKGT